MEHGTYEEPKEQRSLAAFWLYKFVMPWKLIEMLEPNIRRNNQERMILVFFNKPILTMIIVRHNKD